MARGYGAAGAVLQRMRDTLTEFGKDNAEIHHITEKYGEPENCERQIMYIRLDNRLVRVWYQGPDELIDFADLYIEHLKSAE